MWQKILPIEFLVVRKNYLERPLATLPLVKSGMRGNHEVYRVYEADKKTYQEISKSSERGKSLKPCASDVACSRSH